MKDYNIFIYYGTEINKHDYENLNYNNGIIDLYQKIYSHNLQFKEVGDVNHSWQYVIGKELLWERSILTNVNIEKFKLSQSEENEIRTKLLEIGITNPIEYKIFISWL